MLLNQQLGAFFQEKFLVNIDFLHTMTNDRSSGR